VKLQLIAQALLCRLDGPGDVEIRGVAGIGEAAGDQITFVSNRKYARHARSTRAGAIIVAEDFPALPTPTLRSANPYLSFARAIELFYQPPEPPGGIDPTARVAPGVRIGEDASIGPYVVIEEDVEIGPRAVVGPYVHIGRGARVGKDFRAHAHASVREHTRIGDRVILQDGARIGTDGFGYARADDGTWYKIVQSGVVILEDDVEVGANATIDRSSFGETRIRGGVKIDNLVQVGHASRVGENTLLCAQVGLAGSTRVGQDCILTGQVGVSGHLTIGDRVIATGQTGIGTDIPSDSVVSGSPSVDNKTWLRSNVLFRKLPDLVRRIEALERNNAGSGVVPPEPAP
jgi:UDP-3-O-[3-hydroxymyristoyl] glucosamine N-acyltransferase